MDLFKGVILEDVDDLISKIELHSGNIGKVKSKEFVSGLKRVRKDIKNHKFSYAENRRYEKELTKTFGDSTECGFFTTESDESDGIFDLDGKVF